MIPLIAIDAMCKFGTVSFLFFSHCIKKGVTYTITNEDTHATATPIAA